MQTKNPSNAIDKLIVSAAKKGVTITQQGRGRFTLVNDEGAKALITPSPVSGYDLALDGYEAFEAQYGEDGYLKEHAWVYGALCHAVGRLR